MFSAKTFVGVNNENVQLSEGYPLMPNLQEIHVEILGQNDPLISQNQDNNHHTNIYNYFVSALDSNSTSIRHYHCHFCNKKYICFRALYNHAHLKHRESASQPVKCFVCQQLFVFRNEYYDHLSSVHQIRYPEAMCDICLTTFMDTQLLQNHMSCHPAKYSCEKCSIKFLSQNQLSLHHKYHNCNKDLLCGTCGALFQSKLLHGLHLLRHIQVECPIKLNNDCASFTSEIELSNHFKEHHLPDNKALLLQIIESFDKEEQTLAEILQGGTNITFNDPQIDFRRYLSKIKLKQNIECSTCSTKLTSVFQLWIHFYKNHRKSQKCPFCDKRFQGTSDVLVHLGSESCKTSSTIPLTCSQCKEIFQEEQELLKHQLTHVKPLQCSECNAIFQKPSELKKHMQGHGLLPKFPQPVYICPVCSSRWASITHLRRHIRSHADVKPFQCEYCGASFKRQQSLRAHCTSAHSGQSHVCPQCGSTFPTKQALFLHVCRVHVRLRRFVCGICAKPWSQNQDLRRHLSNAHQTEYPPLKKSTAGPFKTIHVLPPIKNLCPEDPLRLKIAEVVEEEERKLSSLNYDFDAGEFTPEDADPENESCEKLGSVPIKVQPTAGSIYLTCGFCNFRCEDLDQWIIHTSKHQPSSNTESVNDQQSSNIQPVSDRLVLNSLPANGQHSLNIQPVAGQQFLNIQPVAGQQFLNIQPVAGQQFLNIQPVAGQQFLNIQPVAGQQFLNIQPVAGQQFLNIQPVAGQQFLNIQPGAGQQFLNIQPVAGQQFLNIQPVPGLQSLNIQPISYPRVLNMQQLSDSSALISQSVGDQQSLNIQPGSEQLALNNQPLLGFPVLVPVVPVQSCALSSAVPINYGTSVTVMPDSGKLTTINQSYAPIDPILTEQPVILPETLDKGPELSEETGTNSNSGELININGMFIRIEQCDENALEIIKNSAGPSISIDVPFDVAENASDDHLSAGNAPDDLLGENAPDNHLSAENAFDDHLSTENASDDPISTEDMSGDSLSAENASNDRLSAGKGLEENEMLTSSDSEGNEINESIEDTTRAPVGKSVVQIDSGELVQVAGSSNAQTSPDTARTWPCDQCGKVIFTAKNLKRHMRLHTGVRPFTCEVCDKSFSERNNLKVHMLTHTRERPYSCPACGKTMRYFKEYVEHNKKHQGIKEHSCSICERSFVRQRDLVRHQSLHFAEKKYQCSVCKKFFPRQDYLKLVHIPQVHGKFPCDTCKKRFESEEKLAEHQHTHVTPSQKRFTCPVCEKSFARKWGMKTHLELHKNCQEHVVCYACPKKFRTMEQMLVHLGKFHKKWRDEMEEVNRAAVGTVGCSVKTEDSTGQVYIQDIINVDTQTPDRHRTSVIIL